MHTQMFCNIAQIKRLSLGVKPIQQFCEVCDGGDENYTFIILGKAYTQTVQLFSAIILNGGVYLNITEST